ncbi:polysulfide reductase [Sphaerisporangium fuscum]|uniref:polysulfide reductase n=1 Tax=Sphaerisporangium fuscum TaxID=2835868 RepID=UPI0027E27D31|nr:polysulfide reductase [Sphaerisporangium fuscum]
MFTRVGALGALVAGSGFLIAELGRPERFLNMLRVFKTTSPMSMGSWILATHGGLTSLAAGSAVTGLFPGAGRAAAIASGVTGPMMATYTAVLVSDTAVPAWHEARRELPFMFAGSALAGAGALGMLASLADPAKAGPARRMAVVGAAMETVAGTVMEHRLGRLADPYRQDAMSRAARLLIASGGALTVLAAVASTKVGRRARVPAAVLTTAAVAALTAGSVCTRFGVLRAGRASAEDPSYTIVSQRERVNARGRRTEEVETPPGH